MYGKYLRAKEASGANSREFERNRHGYRAPAGVSSVFWMRRSDGVRQKKLNSAEKGDGGSAGVLTSQCENMQVHSRVEERWRVPYLHGLRLVHGFDCILCHSSGGKGDKRTACREGGEGGGDKKEQKQDRRFGHVVVRKLKQ